MSEVQVELACAGRVMVITMNRPQVMNALDTPMAHELSAAVVELDARPDIVAAVLTGAGNTFCAGMDLKAFSQTGVRPHVEGRGLGGLTEQPPSTPIIAAVEGFALAGGCEIVLACDLVTAGRGATFGIPEVKRGLIAGSGGLVRLPQRIPVNLAMEVALTGRNFTAEEAHAWGLVNRLVPDGQALAAALDLAEQVAANGPKAVAASKRTISESRHWPTDETWTRMDAILIPILTSDDAVEGARAFVEKRAPEWPGS